MPPEQAADRARPQRSPRLAAIVCAAGSGARFGGANGSKLDQDLHGRSVLARAAGAISREPEVALTVVASPADPATLAGFRDRHGAELAEMGAVICPGGVAERYETVRAGLDHLASLGEAFDGVLVHDAARPCVPRAVVRRVIDALAHDAAVAPAVPVADTLKRAGPTGDASTHRVDRTIDRRGLFACQTPQGFSWALIGRAYAQADLTSTDDAQLVERLGEPVLLVPGDPRNLKITRPGDLELARAIWPTLED